MWVTTTSTTTSFGFGYENPPNTCGLSDKTKCIEDRIRTIYRRYSKTNSKIPRAHQRYKESTFTLLTCRIAVVRIVEENMVVFYCFRRCSSCVPTMMTMRLEKYYSRLVTWLKLDSAVPLDLPIALGTHFGQ
jgi:hypothetical protein